MRLATHAPHRTTAGAVGSSGSAGMSSCSAPLSVSVQRLAASHAMNKSDQIPVYRYATRYLNEVIQCAEPMTDELARRIRSLHRDHGLDYDALPGHLCTGDATGPQAFGAGKILVEIAAFHLREDYRSWKIGRAHV